MSTGAFVPPEFPPIDPKYQIQGPVGPDNLIVNRSFVIPESAVGTGPTGPQHIITMGELLASREVVIAKETADKGLLQSLINPSYETFRTATFQWAGLGFPAGYKIFSLEVTPPSVCSDGVARNLNMYVVYLTESTIEQLVANIQELMPGIQLIYSLSQTNAITLSVSKA